MLRALWFLIVVGAIVFALVWLTDNPGQVALDWRGYRVESSFAVLLGLVIVLAVLAALAYRLWLFLRRAPKQVTGAWRNRRRAQGYQALTQGMVAVAAGDPDEARRQTKRAEVLLNEPPLTMLLSAQTAQLNGDEKAAEEFFKAMTNNPETEFLGLRGLIGQAKKRGESEQALKLTRRAYGLKPKSKWVAQNLFDLQIEEGQWLDAGVTCDDLVRIGSSAKKNTQHSKAVLACQLGFEARAKGDGAVAEVQFKRAVDLDNKFTPAVSAFADALIKQGRHRKAVQLIEKTWASAPHPDLVDPYWRAAEAYDAMARMKASQRLAKSNAGHQESHVAVIIAALEARLWGESRNHLEQITGDAPETLDARICRLWADLEEAEHGNMDKAHEWLTRASLAEMPETWTCSSCGNTASAWSALCGNCQGFDTFAWRRPPHVNRLPEGVSEGMSTLPAVVSPAAGNVELL
jgi:HemY protein